MSLSIILKWMRGNLGWEHMSRASTALCHATRQSKALSLPYACSRGETTQQINTQMDVIATSLQQLETFLKHQTKNDKS